MLPPPKPAPLYGPVACPPTEAERVIELARKSVETRLRSLIDDAKAGKPHAVKKLKIFGSVTDPALATELALLNHDQRRARLAQIRAEARADKKRKRARR